MELQMIKAKQLQNIQSRVMVPVHDMSHECALQSFIEIYLTLFML